MAGMVRVMVMVWLALVSTESLAALTAFVDRNPVALDESFALTVESDGGSGGKPDFSLLQRDFEVMGQSSNSSIQIINGQMSRKQQWRVELMPKLAGEVMIPAFEVGGEQSKPLKLTVLAARQPQTAQQNSDLFFEVSAAPQQPYVQQQLLFSVKLFYSVNMAGGSTLSEPKVSGGNAVIEKLGDNRQYQTTLNSRRYGVLEQNYAIYPQKSGPLTIEPLVFDGNVVEAGQGSFFDPFGQSTRKVRVRSREVKVDVQPIPAGVSGNWLPARTLQLLEQWQEDPPKFVVGEPVTRTLAVMADGLTAAQLPEIGTALPAGVKSYPDQPQLKDTKDGNGIAGLRQQKIALIPEVPGELTLPAIEVQWWNVEKRRMEVARLPERTVTVAPGTGTPSAAAPLPNGGAPQIRIDAEPPLSTPAALTDLAVAAGGTAAAAGWWPWLALALGCGWLITLLLWWRQRRAAAVPSVAAAAAVPPDLRPFEQQLRKGCQQNDPAECRAALLAWGKGCWPHQPPLSLTALAGRCPPALAAAIGELDRVLYAPGGAPWQGTTLWQAFENHKPRAAGENGKGPEAALQPLYRL